MYELDKKDEDAIAALKKEAGSWETLSKILYQFVPECRRGQIAESIKTIKAFTPEPRGTKRLYSFDDLAAWNALVLNYRDEHPNSAGKPCSHRHACKQLLQSKQITLPNSTGKSLDKRAKLLKNELETYRTDKNKAIARWKGKTSAVLDALNDDTP